MDLPIALSVPLWVGVAGPPLLYGIILLCLLRQWTVERLVGGTVLLSAVHVVLGVAAGAVYATLKPGPYDSAFFEALLEFFHAPALQLTWLPLMVLPVLVVLRSPSRSRRRGRRPARGASRESLRRQTAPVLQPAFAGVGGEPNVTLNPGVLAASRTQAAPPSPPSGFIEGRAAALTIDEVIPSAFDRLNAPAATSAPAWPPGEPAKEPSPLRAQVSPEPRPDDVVRIPFNRLRSQFPAEAFTRSLDAVATELRDPWHLWVPRDLVVAQLREGEVAVDWEVVADQFPGAALAMNLTEIGQRLQIPGRLLLPLDEIIRQLPPEMFDLPPALANPRDLESFPEPFHRVMPSPEVVDPPGGPPPAVSLESVPETNRVAPADAAASAQVPPAPPDLSRVDVATVRESAAAAAVASAVNAALAEVSTPAANPRHHGEALPPCEDDTAGAGDVETRRTGIPGAASAGTSAPEEASGASLAPLAVRAGLADPATVLQARQLATVFHPMMPFELGVHLVDGTRIVVLSGSPWQGEGLAATAGRLAPLFAPSERLDTIEQVTLRGSDGAVVVTALGPVPEGAPVLAAAVAQRGAVALFEILSRRAADQYRGAHPAGSATRPTAAALGTPQRPSLEPVAIGASAQQTMQRIMTTLETLGPVTPTVFNDATGERLLYVFAPKDTEPAAVAALARALHAATGVRRTVESIVGRLGHRWLLVRPLAAGADGSALLAVLGEGHHRHGLMHHVVGCAARWLERL